MTHPLQTAIDLADWEGVPITILDREHPAAVLEFEGVNDRDPPRFTIELIPLTRKPAPA